MTGHCALVTGSLRKRCCKNAGGSVLIYRCASTLAFSKVFKVLLVIKRAASLSGCHPVRAQRFGEDNSTDLRV